MLVAILKLWMRGSNLEKRHIMSFNLYMETKLECEFSDINNKKNKNISFAEKCQISNWTKVIIGGALV